ncbi:MAG: sigma-70 family RNA polymerase sigma factor [Thermodesulfobacteriota bacterium]
MAKRKNQQRGETYPRDAQLQRPLAPPPAEGPEPELPEPELPEPELLDPEVLDPEAGSDLEAGTEADLDFDRLGDGGDASLGEEEEAGEEGPAWDESRETPPPATLDTLQRYLWEVRQYPLLSREEEEALSRRYAESADPEAAARLVTSNLRLVVKIAMEHQRYWMRNLLDLIQEGNMGLVQAVKKFDPFRGIKFSYYASFWIRAYILKFIMDNWRLVRLGTTQAQRKLFYNLRREKEKLKAQGIDPGAKLLSDRLGVSEQEVMDMEQRLDSWELSLDAPVREQSDEAHQNFMPDERPGADEVLAEDELRGIFHQELLAFRGQLDDKERDILDRRLLADNPMTLNELGEAHGISRERIRQIQERLLAKLHDYMRDKIPDFDEQFAGLAGLE